MDTFIVIKLYLLYNKQIFPSYTCFMCQTAHKNLVSPRQMVGIMARSPDGWS